MADNNIQKYIYLVCLLFWNTFWRVTPHTVADVQLKKGCNGEVQTVIIIYKQFVKIFDSWKWLTQLYIVKENYHSEMVVNVQSINTYFFWTLWMSWKFDLSKSVLSSFVSSLKIVWFYIRIFNLLLTWVD